MLIINRTSSDFWTFEPGKEKPYLKKTLVSSHAAVISLFKKYMHSVDVNDQYRSYHTVGTLSKKWWKYLAWFFMNTSIVNGLVLQNVQTDWRRRRRHFDFRLLLAKQLFSDFNDYKKHSSAPVSRRNDFDLP